MDGPEDEWLDRWLEDRQMDGQANIWTDRKARVWMDGQTDGMTNWSLLKSSGLISKTDSVEESEIYLKPL